MDFDELKQRVRINKSSLDEELEQQPTYLLACLDELAHATASRDEAKDAVIRIDAEISSEFRASEDKISETKIASMLPLDRRHINAVKRLNALKLEVDRWAGLSEVFRTRGSMLKVLVDLYLSGYFASDSASGSVAAAQSVRADVGRKALAANRRPLSRRG